MGKGIKTDIKIGDVQQGRITEKEAIERIAVTLDANVDNINVICEDVLEHKTHLKSHDKILYGDDKSGGLITMVHENCANILTNRKLLFAFLGSVAIAIVTVVGWAIS